MPTLTEFISANNLTLTSTLVASNPHLTADDEWAKTASHWLCHLTKGNHTIPIHYSQGSAHRRWSQQKLKHYWGTYTRAEILKLSPVLGSRGLGGAPESIALRELRNLCSEPIPPTLPTVLDCLASDASSYETSRSFDDWASDFGMSTDSIRALATYNTIAEQSKRLRNLLGLPAYNTLLYEVERL